MQRLTILVPTQRRPHRIEPTMTSALMAAPDHTTLLFLPDPDDGPEIDELERMGAEWVSVEGNYADKINQGIGLAPADYYFFGANDLHWHPGWYEAAEMHMTGPGGIGVVGTNDLCNPRVMRGDHATHCLVARWYTELGLVDDPTKVINPAYIHEYQDDEFVGTAKMRNAFAHAPNSVVEHLHPMVGKAPTDSFYDATPRRMRQGRRLYHKRRRMWTG